MNACECSHSVIKWYIIIIKVGFCTSHILTKVCSWCCLNKKYKYKLRCLFEYGVLICLCTGLILARLYNNQCTTDHNCCNTEFNFKYNFSVPRMCVNYCQTTRVSPKIERQVLILITETYSSWVGVKSLISGTSNWRQLPVLMKPVRHIWCQVFLITASHH